MIITVESRETSKQIEQHLFEYNWFHPKRVSYHVYRFFHFLFHKEQLGNATDNLPPAAPDKLQLFDFLYDLIHMKYAFPYSRVLALFTLHYVQSIRSMTGAPGALRSKERKALTY